MIASGTEYLYGRFKINLQLVPKQHKEWGTSYYQSNYSHIDREESGMAADLEKGRLIKGGVTC